MGLQCIPGQTLNLAHGGHCTCVSAESLQPCTLCDPMDEAHQAPPSMGFSRQECWSALPCPSPEDPPDPGIEPGSPALAGGFSTPSAAWEARGEHCPGPALLELRQWRLAEAPREPAATACSVRVKTDRRVSQLGDQVVGLLLATMS